MFKPNEHNHLLNHFIRKINQSASTQSSNREPRELFLLEKGREYQIKKIEKIIQKNEKEAANATFSPNINSSCETFEKVENRLINFGINKNSKLEKIRKEKEEIEKISKPVMPNRPKNSEFLKRLKSFQSIYAKNLEKQRILKIEQERSLNKSPEICKNSEKIVKKLGFCGKVENRLLEFGELYRDKQVMVKAAQELSESIFSVPKISPFAQKMNREGNVTERLLAYSRIYERNKEKLNEKFYKKDEKTQLKRDPSVQDRLLRTKAFWTSQRQYSFSPQLSKKTILIAKKLGKSSERLMSPRKNLIEIEDTQCFFYPQINKKSEKIFSKNKSYSGLY
jgi:Fe2+ transport system protein FeoA